MCLGTEESYDGNLFNFNNAMKSGMIVFITSVLDSWVDILGFTKAPADGSLLCSTDVMNPQ